jgi:hypothetical protein
VIRGFLKAVAFLVLLVVVAVAALFVYARFHDGPIALVPGGPLVAGELVTTPVADWSFAADVDEIELQLAYEKTSRTTWIAVKDGAAYIPCNLSFPPGKRWHFAADENGSATVRIHGRLYPVTLVRVKDDAQVAAVGEVIRAKYPVRQGQAEGGVWVFKLEPRVAG